jgi:hypothetical protein
MPKQGSPELKERHVNTYEELLQRYEAEGEGFL